MSLTLSHVALKGRGNIAISGKDGKTWKCCPRLEVTPAAKQIHLPGSNFLHPLGRWEQADGIWGLCPQRLFLCSKGDVTSLCTESSGDQSVL